MRRRGVLIDQDKLAQVEEWSVRNEQAALDEIYRLTGHRIELGNVMSAKLCAPALEAVGIKLPTTPKTNQKQLKAETLEQCGHPAADLLITARKAYKLRKTFATSIRKHMTNGRIHANMNQMARDNGDGGVMGARYGRMSSHNPNIQQQPSRDKFAAMWRSIYLPEHGSLWASLDYSQQEPRLLTHYAYLSGCRGAEKAVMQWRETPRLDSYDMVSELCGIERGAAKTIFLGVCYGMGGGKMCARLGLPTQQKRIRGTLYDMAGQEGQAIIDQFDSRVPYVRELSNRVQKRAQERGFIKTLLGRTCRFPRGNNGYEFSHKALNRLIQGGSADQMKRAMVEMDREGYFLQLQVHDEVDGSFESEAEAKKCAALMRDCVTLEVPCVVDVECGPSWGEIVKEAV
jgi:DNA polymerase I-like protein with 3'-5' exonuclease and polymerase domains